MFTIASLSVYVGENVGDYVGIDVFPVPRK
jgi:hypothetical protein